MSAPDGRSAFPSHGSMGEVEHRGMSLRCWFAGHALAGLIANDKPADSTKDSARFFYKRCAYNAYAIADAMLAERAKFYDAEAKS